MENEVLIYGPIYSFSASEAVKAISAVEGDSLVVRVNSEGGSPEYTWGMVNKFQEFQGEKVVKVDGQAYSSALNFLLYADKVEAVDTARFMLHRASYGWMESYPDMFTEALQQNLSSINASLKTAFKNKVDIPLFEEITGKTLNEVFSMEGRVDVFFTAQEAKKIGLIDKIVKITPKKQQAISAEMHRVAAHFTGVENIEGIVEPEVVATIKQTEVEPSKNKNKMTIEELRSKHPEAYAQAVAMGAKAEQDRAGAWLQFNDVDPKAVAEGIKSGDDMSQTAMAEFSKKMFSAQAIGTIEAEATPPVVTDGATVDATVEDNEISAFEARVSAKLNLKND